MWQLSNTRNYKNLTTDIWQWYWVRGNWSGLLLASRLSFNAKFSLFRSAAGPARTRVLAMKSHWIREILMRWFNSTTLAQHAKVKLNLIQTKTNSYLSITDKRNCYWLWLWQFYLDKNYIHSCRLYLRNLTNFYKYKYILAIKHRMLSTLILIMQHNLCFTCTWNAWSRFLTPCSN